MKFLLPFLCLSASAQCLTMATPARSNGMTVSASISGGTAEITGAYSGNKTTVHIVITGQTPNGWLVLCDVYAQKATSLGPVRESVPQCGSGYTALRCVITEGSKSITGSIQ